MVRAINQEPIVPMDQGIKPFFRGINEVHAGNSLGEIINRVVMRAIGVLAISPVAFNSVANKHSRTAGLLQYEYGVLNYLAKTTDLHSVGSVAHGILGVVASTLNTVANIPPNVVRDVIGA